MSAAMQRSDTVRSASPETIKRVRDRRSASSPAGSASSRKGSVCAVCSTPVSPAPAPKASTATSGIAARLICSASCAARFDQMSRFMPRCCYFAVLRALRFLRTVNPARPLRARSGRCYNALPLGLRETRGVAEGVRKGKRVASKLPHVYFLGPAVRGIVEEVRAAGQRHVARAAAVDKEALSPRQVFTWCGIHREALALERTCSPALELIVGNMHEVRLMRDTDICPVVDPTVRLPVGVRAALHVIEQTQVCELVTAQPDDNAWALRPAFGQHAGGLEPAGDAPAALAGTLPPAAEGRRDDERRELGPAARNACHHVVLARLRKHRVRDECDLAARLRRLLQPFGLGTRDLKDGDRRRIGEGERVEQEEARAAAAREQHYGLVRALARLGDCSALLAARLQKCEGPRLGKADVRIASKWADTSADSSGIGERSVERWDAVHAPVPDPQVAGLRNHPAELERLQRGRKAAPAQLPRKPLRRGEIRFSSGAVVSLRVVDLYPSREPLFQRLVP